MRTASSRPACVLAARLCAGCGIGLKVPSCSCTQLSADGASFAAPLARHLPFPRDPNLPAHRANPHYRAKRSHRGRGVGPRIQALIAFTCALTPSCGQGEKQATTASAASATPSLTPKEECAAWTTSVAAHDAKLEALGRKLLSSGRPGTAAYQETLSGSVEEFRAMSVALDKIVIKDDKLRELADGYRSTVKEAVVAGDAMLKDPKDFRAVAEWSTAGGEVRSGNALLIQRYCDALK